MRRGERNECCRCCIAGIIAINRGRSNNLVHNLRLLGPNYTAIQSDPKGLKRLVGPTGRASSDVTGSTGTVLVNGEEYSQKTSKGIIQKGAGVSVMEAAGLTLLVEEA